ncbi:MAG: Ig-like domain-containing protein [Candidatus Margulisbacteria bacterium]|nr:Ig-like domain-containing protein [Candidatus Margulisiibacteriota bacterium]
MIKKIFSLFLLLLMGVVISSCGQTNPTITTTESTPQNLVIKGTVYEKEWIYDSGYYSSVRKGPVAGVTVVLSGSYETQTSVTGANGEYVFEKVKPGYYYIISTKDGYQPARDEVGTFTFGFAVGVLDNSFYTQDIELSPYPVIKSLTPSKDSTIETSASFTLVFNKAMDTSTVRPKITATGPRFFAAGDTVNMSAAWSTDQTTLTLTPNSPLLPNQTYRLYLAGEPSQSFADVKDAAGHSLAIAYSSSGYGVPVETPQECVVEESLYFTYRTASGATPSAPTNLALTIGTGAGGKMITSSPTSGADYNEIYAATNINLTWTPSTGNITGYRVYLSDNPTNNFRLAQVGSAYYVTANYATLTMTNVLNTLYGTTLIDPFGTPTYPMVNQPLYVKVVAFNGESESVSAECNARDQVGPRFDPTYKKYGYAGAVVNNGSYLPAIDTANKKVVYLGVMEPLDASTVTAGNFSITAGGGTSIVSVAIMANSSVKLTTFGGTVYCVLRVETTTDMDATTKIKMGSAVLDLSGNAPYVGSTLDDVILTGF